MPIKNIFKTYKIPLRNQKRTIQDGHIVRDKIEILKEKELTLQGQLAITKLKEFKPFSKLDQASNHARNNSTMTEILPRTDQISYLIGGLKVPKVKEKHVEAVIESDQLDF